MAEVMETVNEALALFGVRNDTDYQSRHSEGGIPDSMLLLSQGDGVRKYMEPLYRKKYGNDGLFTEEGRTKVDQIKAQVAPSLG